MSATVSQIKNSPSVTKRTLIIDSINRTSGKIANFNYDFGTTYNNIQLIEIVNVSFINIINNINNTNNKINWIDPLGVTHLNELPIGNYNLETLAEDFGNVLSNNTTDDTFFTVDFNFTTNKITISNTTNKPFCIKFGVSPDENIGKVLGFGITDCIGVTTITGDKNVNLLTTKSIFIGSTILKDNSLDEVVLSNGISNTIYELYLDNIFGNVINNGDRVISLKSASPYSLSSIDFTLYNDSGLLLPLTNDVNEEIQGIFKIKLDIYSGIFDLSYYD